MATIRSMTPADYAAVAAMAHDAAARGLVGRPVWCTAADVAAEVAAFPGAVFLVAEEGGDVVGMAGYRLTECREAEVYGPLVAHEGVGIGAWLEGRVTTLAKQAGAEACSMLIGLGNRSGAAWAEWRGYHPDTEAPKTLLCWAFPGEIAAPAPAFRKKIRPARPEDLDRIMALHFQAFPADEASRNQWCASLPRCRVLEQDGQVLGFCRIEQPIPCIRVLCIDPEYRRKGLGSELLRSVLTELWEQADRPVPLKAAVRLDNAAAVQLCRRVGFRQEIPVAKWTKLERDVEVDEGTRPED